jgi:hypothetical protein
MSYQTKERSWFRAAEVIGDCGLLASTHRLRRWLLTFRCSGFIPLEHQGIF